MEGTGADGAALLHHLDHLLSSDPLIDEVGFVHPSHLASLHEEATPQAVGTAYPLAFWCADHKLAISSEALVPLYRTAKSAFLRARKGYDRPSECGHVVKDLPFWSKELLSQSRTLVLLNPGYKTAWDVRKKVLANLSTQVPLEELHLGGLALSINPKCEEAWAHRRWTLRTSIESSHGSQIPQHLLEQELKLVKIIAERSRMNYRAWRHCCWLVQWMSHSQMLNVLQRWKKWVGLNVADNCCFHFRRCLFQRLLMRDNGLEMKDTWLVEVEWTMVLIKRYLGREALWVHLRFLFFVWAHNLKQAVRCSSLGHGMEEQSNQSCNQPVHEAGMAFANDCIASCRDDETDDAQRQRVFASAFKLWVFWVCEERLASSSPLQQRHSNDLQAAEQLLRMEASHCEHLWEGLFKKFHALSNESLR